MKKAFSIILSVLLLCSMTTPAALADDKSASNAAPYIEARYAEFSMVYASLYKTSSGFYHVEGGAATYDNDLLVNITLTIEGCDTDGVFRPVENYEWTASGYQAAATQATRDLPGGGYKAHIVAKCYRNGVLLETVESYSSIVNVPYV